jgi:hypothetical protein
LGEAFDAACKEVHGKGQPAIVYEVIVKRIMMQLKTLSAIYSSCAMSG